MDISVIIPIRNGEKWIDSCMKSIASQSVFQSNLNVEIIVHNDGSTDNTKQLLTKWKTFFTDLKVKFLISETLMSGGVGAAKNRAIFMSNGQYLCFQDIDDLMFPNRIKRQYDIAKANHTALVGSRIKRYPENSTPRFVRWANNLSSEQLQLQIYTSNGPTILMPTWFCHKEVFNKVGGFIESRHGYPEDLVFFHKHLDCGGKIIRVEEELVSYTYHEEAATFSVSRECIWKIQLRRLEDHVLSKWKQFSIWNAGKAGRKLVRALLPENVSKVVTFCDVDVNKIGRIVELYCPRQKKVFVKIPVIHFSEATPPIIICVKMDLTLGDFERNLQTLHLKEGNDYVFFG